MTFLIPAHVLALSWAVIWVSWLKSCTVRTWVASGSVAISFSSDLSTPAPTPTANTYRTNNTNNYYNTRGKLWVAGWSLALWYEWHKNLLLSHFWAYSIAMVRRHIANTRTDTDCNLIIKMNEIVKDVYSKIKCAMSWDFGCFRPT